MGKVRDILRPLVEFAFVGVKEVAEAEHVAVRLWDGKGGFPLVRWAGFTEGFVRRIFHDDHDADHRACLCYYLCRRHAGLMGRFCRASGALVVNNLSEGLGLIRETIEGFSMSCACEEAGFRSLAVFPFGPETEGGVFLMAEEHPGFFDERKVTRLESLVTAFSALWDGVKALAEGGRRYRILVAEDEEIVGRLWIKVLGRFGYDCTLCADGAEAWERLQGGRFDLVVTDLLMPRMGGLELVRRLRERYGVYSPDVVVVTARPELVGATEREQYRIGEVLAKPLENIFVLPEVVERIRGRG